MGQVLTDRPDSVNGEGVCGSHHVFDKQAVKRENGRVEKEIGLGGRGVGWRK